MNLSVISSSGPTVWALTSREPCFSCGRGGNLRIAISGFQDGFQPPEPPKIYLCTGCAQVVAGSITQLIGTLYEELASKHQQQQSKVR